METTLVGKDGAEEMKDLAVGKIHKLVNESLRREIEESVRSAANLVVEELLQRSSHNNHRQQFTKGAAMGNGSEAMRIPKSSGKVFMARDSLLTELLEVTHIRTIYHIFIVILIILFLNIIVYDYVDKGSINLGVSLIATGFGKMDTVLWIWCVMKIIVLLAYPLLGLWAHWRERVALYVGGSKAWDVTWILWLAVCQSVFLCSFIGCAMVKSLPIASSIVVIVESIRMMMKVHAFVRSVTPRLLGGGALPPFSSYLYFLFAPTLVYRDSYPRTSHIRWKVVIFRLLEIAGTIFYISFLCERFLVRNFRDFGKTDQVLNAKDLVISMFSSILPGLVTYLCGFYLLLHSWLNVTAELLTFADRQFYMDWWNQWSYAVFYRIWNMVVHDWLYTYVYLDILALSRSRLVATLSVFTISAIFHEIILIFSFGFFYPVLLIMFGVFGVSLVFLTKHINKSVGNIFMWWSLAVGNGMLWNLYGMEYFARINCPRTRQDFTDYLVPRSWSCHQYSFDRL